MTKTRRAFAPDFKREAVALLKSSNRPLIQIAAELGMQPSMLRNWRAVESGAVPLLRAGLASGSSSESSPALPTPADLASENAKLRRELERTRIERDILGKAIGIFAEMPK